MENRDSRHGTPKYSMRAHEIMEAVKGGTFTVYHGTAASFKGFDDRQLGSAHGSAPINMTGFNFTDNPECAATFGPNVLKCEVTILRPMVVDAKGQNYSDFKHILNDKLFRLDKPAIRAKYDGVIIKNYADAGIHGDVYIESNHFIPFTRNQIRIIGRNLAEGFAPSMHDFLDDDVVDEILRTGNWVDHGSEIEQWWDTAGYETVDGPVSHMRYKEARTHPEFRAALWSVLRQMASSHDDVLANGSKYDGVGKLEPFSELWRVIWVNAEWKPHDGIALGIYWSPIKGWKSRFIDNDYSDGELNRCIMMRVHARNVVIDWKQTARSRFSYDHGLEEHEIQLVKGSPLTEVFCYELKDKAMHHVGTVGKGFA